MARTITGANKRATETQKDIDIRWSELQPFIQNLPIGINPNTNITDRQIIKHSDGMYKSANLSPEAKFRYSMKILDKRGSHTYGLMRHMLSLIGKISSEQEEKLVSKLFSVKVETRFL